MNSLAIFGPRPAWKEVRSFARVTSRITPADTPLPGADAVLIFGGDGTVHRHLQMLLDLQIRALDVPSAAVMISRAHLGLRPCTRGENSPRVARTAPSTLA
jgi:hypothetical protein